LKLTSAPKNRPERPRRIRVSLFVQQRSGKQHLPNIDSALFVDGEKTWVVFSFDVRIRIWDSSPI
jgi:hypothetical protein